MGWLGSHIHTPHSPPPSTLILTKRFFKSLKSETTTNKMKFGKQIQKRQLEVPEYAASFTNYKALKKLIKKLSATPVLQSQNGATGVQATGFCAATPGSISGGLEHLDSQAALQANKATFFFQLVKLTTLFPTYCPRPPEAESESRKEN